MKGILIDDGTLDTVIQVGNKQYRYNYDGELGLDDVDGEEAYNAFIDWALTDAEEQYEMDKVMDYDRAEQQHLENPDNK